MGSVKESFDLIKNDPSKVLGLTVGKHTVTTPGQHIPKAEAQDKAAPEISSNISTGSYIVISLDLDAPFVSFNFLSPILHWLQSGLRPTPKGDGSYTLSAGATPYICNWGPPGPPGPSGPHRYIFLLYEQPEGFDIRKFAPAAGKPVGLGKRIRYDLPAFEKEAKLGPVIAFNYFNSN